jgi:hypothetical protein
MQNTRKNGGRLQWERINPGKLRRFQALGGPAAGNSLIGGRFALSWARFSATFRGSNC